MTKSTVLQGQSWEANDLLGRKFKIPLTIPSGYTPYNIDSNIQGTDRFKIGFDNFSDISSSSPNVYITHVFNNTVTIPVNPTDQPPVLVLITTLLIKN